MPFDSTNRPIDHLIDASAGEAVEQLTVTVRNVLFSNPENGYFIAEVELAGEGAAPAGASRASRFGVEVVLLKGESPSFVEHANASVGQSLAVAGQWDQDARGIYFKVMFTQESVPTTREALGKYLADGRLKGIGPATARRLLDRFNMDLLRILDHDPDRLAEESGITLEKARSIAMHWKTKREQFQVVSFLGVHGIGENLAKKVAAEWGSADLEDRIRADPYLLTHIDGIGFKKADHVAMSVGLPVDSPLRIRAALVDVLQQQIQNAGNTAVPVSEWVKLAMAFVSQPQKVVEEHCSVLIKERRVVLRKINFQRYVRNELVEGLVDCASPFRLGLKENAIARSLIGHLTGNDQVSSKVIETLVTALSDPSLGLDPSQREASLMIARNAVAILTGGPGTGKTTTLRSVVKAFEDAGLTVVLAAPTGRAAKRMEEAIGRPSATIHRTLEFKGSLGFTRDSENPLVGDVFILDETSMVDTALMDAWLSALPPEARILFVGDADQLPSVGPGNVMRDLIDCRRIPVARLTTVHRNGGLIAKTAARVLSGKSPTLPADPWVDTFAFVPAETDEQIIETVNMLIDGFLNKGQDPRGIQVLVPQKEGVVGTHAFNDSLRQRLNVEPRSDWSTTAMGANFLKGDRVMQVKNDYKREVYNGDMGHVTEVFDGGRELMVELENGTRVKYAKEEQRELELGYAQTVHKSQGGERPIIIMVCANAHSFTLNRNLLYTGITRGKERVLLVGHAKAAALAAFKVDQGVRLTGLKLEIERVWKQVMAAKAPAPTVSAPPARSPGMRP
jgi:exodeoxyribonuclease V alpha subunit